MKRFFQFRLRTMLVVVTALSLYLGWLVQRAKEQRAAVAAIQELGGWIYYDFQVVNDKYDPNGRSWAAEWLRRHLGIDFFHDVVHVNMVYNDGGPQRLDNAITTDAATKFIARLPDVEFIALKDGQATDNALRKFGKLKRLRAIYMWDAAQVSDAGILELRNLPKLKYIHCSNAQITDESLKTFSTLKKMEGLSLQGNHFTDRGIGHVAALPKLNNLWLGTGLIEVTDAGLAMVVGIKQLQVLEISDAPVTRDGLKSLMSARPGLTIYHDLVSKMQAAATTAGSSATGAISAD